MTTKIEYADDVVNDQGGCDKIRAGCRPTTAKKGGRLLDGRIHDGA